jgi:hypothetical protein
MNSQKEFGDFQTPLSLAKEVVALIDALFGAPERVVEPTAGVGTFLDAAQRKWGVHSLYQGFEINPVYVEASRGLLSNRGIHLEQQDFFKADWKCILNSETVRKVLILGNPPWVTNATLGTVSSVNLPKKTNFQGLRGFDAKTGKANFDIAEWMLIRLMEALSPLGAIAMLCKTMTARKVLKHLWKTQGGFVGSSLFLIDAKRHFDVSVDACLFFATGMRTIDRTANVYSELSTSNAKSEFGLIDGHLVSDVSSYKKYRDLDGDSPYTWRSGIKHDASEIMELEPINDHYQNGFGEDVAIEPHCVYPLLKSSDLGNGRTKARRAVLITQKNIGDKTEVMQRIAPKTWRYLESHASQLDDRKSSIYHNRPRFSIFGIGDYSFSAWKVAISGLYKSLRFVVIPPQEDRPVMVDDTCYFIPCQCEDEAELLSELLNSDVCRKFLASLVFNDSKRPITSEVLRRISLVALARRLNRLDEIAPYIQAGNYSPSYKHGQMSFVMEDKKDYQIKERKRRG